MFTVAVACVAVAAGVGLTMASTRPPGLYLRALWATLMAVLILLSMAGNRLAWSLSLIQDAMGKQSGPDLLATITFALHRSANWWVPALTSALILMGLSAYIVWLAQRRLGDSAR